MFLRNYAMDHTEATLVREMQWNPTDDTYFGLDDFDNLLSFAVSKPFRRRVEEFAGGRQKKSRQRRSPRVRGKRSGSARQTPVQKRAAATQKTTPVATPASESKPGIPKKPPVAITSPPKPIRPDVSDSDDFDSDVVVTGMTSSRRQRTKV
jgi:hypothetical protein